MRNILLVILLIAALLYVGSERFSFVSGKDKNGNYHLVMVDKRSGNVTTLLGKK